MKKMNCNNKKVVKPSLPQIVKNIEKLDDAALLFLYYLIMDELSMRGFDDLSL